MKCGFGISRKYQSIWVPVSISDLNQNSGFSRTLVLRIVIWHIFIGHRKTFWDYFLYGTNLLALLLRENNNNCEIERSCGANMFYTPVLSLLKCYLNFKFLKMSESVNNRCIICFIKRGYHQKARFFWRKSCTVSWCVQVVACRCSLKTCILHWLLHQTYKIIKTFEGKGFHLAI